MARQSICIGIGPAGQDAGQSGALITLPSGVSLVQNFSRPSVVPFDRSRSPRGASQGEKRESQLAIQVARIGAGGGFEILWPPPNL